MRRYVINFDSLDVGASFSLNGYRWVKRSTRTAQVVKPSHYSAYWRYFAQRERVTIGGGI